jgi:hypothetical protein
MGEAGIFGEDERVELIEGEVVEMNPIGSRHAACVRELTRLLSRQLGEERRLGVQNLVRLGEYEEPQPDLAVLRVHDYAGSLPGSEDVLLLIEVSDTTLARDRNVNYPCTSGRASRRPGSWPLGRGYRAPHETVGRGRLPAYGASGVRAETLRSEVLPDLIVPVDAVLA